MRNIYFIFALLSTVLLSGCQTVPPAYTKQTTFTKAPQSNEGKVIFSTLHVPPREPGVKDLRILSILVGGPGYQPYNVGLFDVTGNQTQYIGQLSNWYDPARKFTEFSIVQWLEYTGPVGKRTFMLIHGPIGSTYAHADFLDVDIDSQQVKHVAFSQHGLSQYPYFNEILFNKQRYETCSSFKADSTDKLKDRVEQYMKTENIKPNAKDFIAYCMGMSAPGEVITPTEENKQQVVAKILSNVEAKKKSSFAEWQKQADKNPTYDLMHVTEPVKAQKSPLESR